MEMGLISRGRRLRAMVALMRRLSMDKGFMTIQNEVGRRTMGGAAGEGGGEGEGEVGLMRLDIDSIKANHAVSLRQEGEHLQLN
jgi:hypothetical protein